MPVFGGSGAHARALNKAKAALKEALAILDEINAPPDIGAHVDRAIHRIDEINAK